MKRYPVLIAAVLALAGLGLTQIPASAGATNERRSPATRDVTAHLFQWPWRDLARECTNVVGPAGYAAVQVMPPQEHVVLPANGYPW